MTAIEIGISLAMSSKSAREFYCFVRNEFAYLEADDGPNPNCNVISVFYESIFRRGYPFWRGCGYWNVFLNFDLEWDDYDNLFALSVARRTGPSEVDTSKVVHLGEILTVLDASWPSGWRNFDTSEGPEQVKRYAKAIKPYAREIFIPQDREAAGFQGFSWYAGVKARTNDRDRQ